MAGLSEASKLVVRSDMLRADHSHSQCKTRTSSLWSLLTFFVLTIPLQDANKINKSFNCAY